MEANPPAAPAASCNVSKGPDLPRHRESAGEAARRLGRWLRGGGAVMALAVSPAAAEPARVAQTPIDAIAVCPAELQPALQGWLQRRAAEGLWVQVIEPEPTAAALKQKIAQTARQGETRYVVLIGDTHAPSAQQFPGAQQLPGEDPRGRVLVPTIYQHASATAPWQAHPYLPGDHRYGDFDDDGRVDAAVGRLPVRNLAQTEQLLQRIAAYEESRDFGNWRSRVDLVAGLGGFGPLVDGAIETIASGMITGSLPGSVRTRVTHAGPESLFCPGADCFTDTVLSNYAQGARFWVYAGHGHVRELDRVPATPQGRPVLSTEDVEQLKRSADAAPIALMLACYTGAYDATEDCLAEQMLLAPGGPIAVLAGSRVTMPYGNAAAAMGLIHSVYHRKPQRLGDAWRETLLEMATPSDAEPGLQGRRMVIDGLASMLGDGRIDEERRDHMQLYNWLGDPTMRLVHPEEIEVEPPASAGAGQRLALRGTSPHSGQMTIELHRRLGTLPPGSSARRGEPAPDQAAQYALANDTAVAVWPVEIARAGPWEVELPLPADSAGPMRLVLDLQGAEGFATGSQNLWIRPE